MHRVSNRLDKPFYTWASWIGVFLIVVALIIVAWLGRWPGVAILAVLLAASIGLLVWETRLPSLFDLLFVSAALLNGLGWVGTIYDDIPGYDEVAHAYTSFAATLAIGYLALHEVRMHFKGRIWLFILVTASVGLALGALWEIFEMFLGILTDPGSDLLLDTIGALAGGGVAALVLRREMQQRAPEAGADENA